MIPAVAVGAAGGEGVFAHGDHAGKIEVIDPAGAVVAAAARVVQSAAEVDDRRVRMLAQIVPHLPCRFGYSSEHIFRP